MIKKDGVNYDSTDHSLTWKVTVNPNKVDLTEAILVDDLSASNPAHRFIPDDVTKDAVIAGIEAGIRAALIDKGVGSEVLESTTLENNILTMEFGNIGKKQFCL